MNVLWIFAHPEQRSLNAALRDDGVRELRRLGHDVCESDLYAMKWKAVLDGDDVRQDPADRLLVGPAQERAYKSGELSADVRAEQDKLRWAEAVVFHFPLWWHGPPAILKGWFDRVLTQGFGFGVKDGDGRTLRYGEGALSGRRALLVTSVGARERTFGPRGLHGHIDDVLFSLLHGAFWYTGMAALPPFVVYGADRLTVADQAAVSERFRARLRTLPTAAPIPYRYESGGDYDENRVLRPEIEPGLSGLAVHRRSR
jgi:NAD(P)H dehydrogenase (quinone)